MAIKPYDLTDAVSYHHGAFPPASLDYEVLLGPLEEAAASLARYDAKMSGMVNSELFRRQGPETHEAPKQTVARHP